MATLKHLLDRKGHEVWSIHPDKFVLEAIEMMADHDVGSLLVMEGDQLVGIFTERHYARDVILKGKTSPKTAIREIMTSRVLVVGLDKTVDECMAIMTEKRVRHLPVMDEGKLIGVISIGDLVKSIIAEQKFTIEQLEHYIAG